MVIRHSQILTLADVDRRFIIAREVLKIQINWTIKMMWLHKMKITYANFGQLSNVEKFLPQQDWVETQI